MSSVDSMESLDCDVVVVGAGLSGLTAAYHLLQKDRSLKVKVIEAKERVGGRTYTVQLKSADGQQDFWDVGGEWVGRSQFYLKHLLNKFDIDFFQATSADETLEVPSQNISFVTRLDLKQLSWRLSRLRNKFLALGSDVYSCVLAFECDGITFEAYIGEVLWTKEAKELINVATRCLFGLDSSEMSLLYFVMNVSSAGGIGLFTKTHEYKGKDFRVKGGVQQLCNHLVQNIGKGNILLRQPVININQDDNTVTVITEQRQQIRCMRVIIAIPPHQAAKIRFVPALPSHKIDVLNKIPLAFVLKFVFSYDQAFWCSKSGEKDRHGFQTVLEDPEYGPLGIVYDGTSARGNPALVGFITLGKIENLQHDMHVLEDKVLDLLENILGPEVKFYIDFYMKDWSIEPYNGGCFLKSLIPGSTKYFNQTLREIVDRVHFAGTETGTVWCGLMNGAVQAGFRTANEVLFYLRPKIVTSLLQDLHQPEFQPNSKKPSNTGVWIYIAFGVSVAMLTYGAFKGYFSDSPIRQYIFNLQTE